MNLLTFTPTYLGVTRYLRSLNLSKNSRILDAGCGTGKLTSFLHSEGYDILGVDTSDEALALTQSKGVPVRKADILKGLPFEDNTFDLVYSDGLLEHFTDPAPIINELSRVGRKYLVTFVPRIELYSSITAAVLKPPLEYKRPDQEWIQLHAKIPHNDIRSEKIRFGLLAVLVELKK